MAADVPLRCSCGSVRGVLREASESTGNRIVCYCDDCQSFAHFLGRANDVLDAWGGTDIFQTSPARVEITEGREHLACVRLRPKGMRRWYAECCRTPLGNTISGSLPFVGVIASSLDDPDEARGPVRARVNARFAKGDRSSLDAHDRGPLSLVLRVVGILLGSRLRGDQRRSPFYDPETLEPIAKPRVLTEDELARVEATRDASG